MHRRDFFSAAITQIAATTAPKAICSDNIEALIAKRLQPCLDRMQSLETDLRKTFSDFKMDAAVRTNQVNVLSDSVTAISEQLKRSEYQQQFIFLWLIMLTVLSGIDVLTIATFYVIS